MILLYDFINLLPHEVRILIFMSIEPTNDRLYLYDGIVDALPENMKNYWVNEFFIHNELINIGVTNSSIF